MVTKGEVGGIIWECRINRYILLYRKQDKHIPTVEHRELFQKLVITCNGKESEKQYICECI